jgi:GNAT superfamily N-acetyltransferase
MKKELFREHIVYKISDGPTDPKRSQVIDELKRVLSVTWGKFPEIFFNEHVVKSEILVLAFVEGKLIGFCAASNKRIRHKNILYVEFLIVDPAYQRKGIGSRMLRKLFIRQMFVKNFPNSLFHPLDVMFITPSIRVLRLVAKTATRVYPNIYNMDMSGRVPAADVETWNLARSLIARSDNPSRKILREGLVLLDSYRNTPWLKPDKSFTNTNDGVARRFVKTYMKPESDEDREFIVRAKYSFGRFVTLTLKR